MLCALCCCSLSYSGRLPVMASFSKAKPWALLSLLFLWNRSVCQQYLTPILSGISLAAAKDQVQSLSWETLPVHQARYTDHVGTQTWEGSP